MHFLQTLLFKGFFGIVMITGYVIYSYLKTYSKIPKNILYLILKRKIAHAVIK